MTMLCHLYVRNETAYVPTAAKTQAGYYLDIEPVEVTPISDEESLMGAIRRSIDRGHPTIPTPTRATGFPKPVVLAYVKVRSLADFEKDAAYWQLHKEDDLFRIEQWKRGEQGGWLPNPPSSETLPLGASVDDAVKRLIDSVQSVASNHGT